MKKMGWVLSLVASLSTSALVYGDLAASRIPDNAFLYVDWQGSENIQKSYQGSHLQALAKESTIPALLDGGLATLVAKAPPYIARDLKPLLYITDEMKLVWKHPAALYIGSVVKEDTAKEHYRMPKVAFLFQAGADADAIYEKLEPNFTNANQFNHPKLTRNGNDILITYGYLSDQEVALLLGNPSTTKSLASNSDYQQALRQVSKNAALTAYFHGKDLIDAMNNTGAPQDMVKNIDDNWDINGTKSVIITQGFNGKDWGQNVFVATNTVNHKLGLTAGLADKEITTNQLKLIPSTATIAIATTLDISATLQDVQQRLEQNAPSDSDSFDSFKTQFQQNLGLDLDKDILNPLGSQWTIYTDRTVGGSALTSVLVINQLRDSATFAKTLQSIEDNSSKFDLPIRHFLGNMVPTSRPSRVAGSTTQKAPSLIRHSTINGVTIYQAGNGMMGAAWAVANDQFYFALSPNTITAALAFQKSGGKSILDNPNFQALQTRLLPAGAKPTNISFVDYTGVVPELYAGASILLMQSSGWMSPEISPTLLPPLATLNTEMVPGGSFTWVDKEGYHSQSTSPTPVLNLVGLPTGLNVAVQNIIAIPVVETIQSSKWRSQYMGENNAREIIRVCMVYSEKHEGRFPENLAELVANKTLPARTLLMPGSSKKKNALQIQDDWHKIAKDVEDYSDYLYFGGASSSSNPNLIVLLAKKPGGTGKNSVFVGYADGHSESIRLKQLEDLIEENNKLRQEDGLPKIVLPASLKQTK